MKRYLVSILLLVLSAGPVLAQSGAVCLYSDVDGTQCTFDDAVPGVILFYAFHTQTPGATAVQFAAPLPPCMTGVTFLADAAAFPVTIGNSQQGVSVAYSGCFAGPIHVLTITAYGNGQTAANCPYPVVPSPGQASLYMVDCNNMQLPATGGVAYVNSSTPCICEAVAVPPELDFSPPTLVFGEDLTDLDFQITNVGGGTLSWGVESENAWASVSPNSGTGAGTVTVTVDRTGLAVGGHSGAVNITSNGGSGRLLLYMSVPSTAYPPVLDVNPTYLYFPAGQTVGYFTISNVGEQLLEWSVVEGIPWLSTDAGFGARDRTVEVTVDRTGLAEGTYTGEIHVNSNGGNETVVVEMVVPFPEPLLSVSPPSLDFPAGTNSLVVTVSNVGTGTLSWNIAPSQPWLTVNYPSGTDNQIVSVFVDRTGLDPGTYNANLAITSNGGSANVPVTMQVPLPVPILGFSPASLSFAAGVSQLSLNITNEGPGTLSWTVTPSESWVSVDPVSGTDDGTVIVDVDRSGLGDGNYAANLIINSNGGSAGVPIMMTVATQPILVLDRTLLVFNQFSTERHFLISNGGVSTLEWSLAANQPWIVIDPPLTGSGDADVTVRIDHEAVPPGSQTGQIDVTSNGGNAAVTVRYNPITTTFPGWLQPSADTGGTQCNIVDAAPGLLTIHIVHMNTNGSTASSFSTPQPACFTATYLSDTAVFGATIGNSQTGVAIAYGTCLAGSIHVLTMNFFAQGTTPPCCLYPVLPHPQNGTIEAVDCNLVLGAMGGTPAVINANYTCDCGPLLAIEESTWGHIKSLYAPERE